VLKYDSENQGLCSPISLCKEFAHENFILIVWIFPKTCHRKPFFFTTLRSKGVIPFQWGLSELYKETKRSVYGFSCENIPK